MILEEYNYKWISEFRELERVYKNALGSLVIAVEHVGSTAIPDIMAKPIIDIDIVMQDYGSFPAIIDKLSELGYTHVGDLGIQYREAFKREDEFTPTTQLKRKWTDHHLYVCPMDSEELKRHVLFRDYLRLNEDSRLEYEKIKLGIAAKTNGDRTLYAHIKEKECRNFIEEVLKKATKC